MATNRGVACMGPGKVDVQSIDVPKLALSNRKCETQRAIPKVMSTNPINDRTRFAEFG